MQTRVSSRSKCRAQGAANARTPAHLTSRGTTMLQRGEGFIKSSQDGVGCAACVSSAKGGCAWWHVHTWWGCGLCAFKAQHPAFGRRFQFKFPTSSHPLASPPVNFPNKPQTKYRIYSSTIIFSTVGTSLQSLWSNIGAYTDTFAYRSPRTCRSSLYVYLP